MGDMADYYRDSYYDDMNFIEHEEAAVLHIAFAQYRKTGVCKIRWTTLQGEQILISDMETSHLANSKAMLQRERYRSASEEEMLRILDYELQKRIDMAKRSDNYYDPALSWDNEGDIEHTKDNTEELFRFFDHNPYGLNTDKNDAFIASLSKWFHDKGELTPNQFKALSKMYLYQCHLAGNADAYHEDRGL